jgi:hypothetical protein
LTSELAAWEFSRQMIYDKPVGECLGEGVRG